MKPSELRELLGKVADLLEENQKVATPQALNLVDVAVDAMRNASVFQAALASLMGGDLNRVKMLLAALEGFVDVERKLATEEVGGKLVAVLRKLQKRPVILTMLAGLV